MPRVSASKVLEPLSFGACQSSLPSPPACRYSFVPLGALEGPFVLLAQFHLVREGTPDVEPYPRLLLPAVALSLEIVVEEAFLQLHPVFEIEPLLVSAGVRLEPFLLGCRLREGLEVAARVQAEARPARRAEEGDGHARPVRRAGAVPVVVHLAGQEVLQRVGPGSPRALLSRGSPGPSSASPSNGRAGRRGCRAAQPRLGADTRFP